MPSPVASSIVDGTSTGSVLIGRSTSPQSDVDSVVSVITIFAGASILFTVASCPRVNLVFFCHLLSRPPFPLEMASLLSVKSRRLR